MALDLLSPDQANPFADLIAPGSGNLGITPEPQNPFADLIHPDTQATDAAHANLIGGGTADAPAYQEVGGFFRDVPRGVAVSTTDYGPFNDLVATAQPKPITNYAEQFGSFADLVPQAAPETEKQAANIRNEQITSGNPALDRILARQKELESGLGPKNWWDKLKQEFTDTISDVTDINQQKRAIIPPDRIADLLTPSYDASTATTLDQHARVAALRIGEGVSGLVTPENALIVGSLAGAPALVGRLVSAGFGLTAAKSVYDQSKQLVTQDTTPLEKTRLVTGILIDGAFTAVMGRHAIRGEPAIRGEQNAIPKPNLSRRSIIESRLSELERQFGPRERIEQTETGLKSVADRAVTAEETRLLNELDTLPTDTVEPTAADKSVIPQAGNNLAIAILMRERNRLFVDELPKQGEGTNGQARVQAQIDSIDSKVRGLIEENKTQVAVEMRLQAEAEKRGKTNAIQEPSTTSEVLRTGQAGENVPSDTGRVEPINPQGTPPGAGPPETAPTEAVPPATQAAPTASGPINPERLSPKEYRSKEAERLKLLSDIGGAFEEARKRFVEQGGSFEINFGPLELVMPKEHLEGWMFMGSHLLKGTERRLFDYKHGITRRGITLDLEGNAYRYDSNKDTYVTTDLKERVDRVYEGIERMSGGGITRVTPYDEAFIKRRNEILKNAGFDTVKGTLSETSISEAETRSHRAQIISALQDLRPVSSEAVDQYGIALPDGYQKRGELYVYANESATSPNDLRPALKTDSGIIEGQKGQEHAQVITDNPQAVADTVNFGEENHGFVNVNDPQNFISRAQGQEALGLDKPLSSQTLIELQKASEQPTKGGETVTGVPTPEAPVTPKKAADEIKTEIVAGKRDPAEIKNEIVQRVQGALDKLAEDDKVEIKQSEYDPERYGITPTNGRRSVMAEITEISPGKWQAAFKDPGESTTTKINGGSFEEITANLKSRFSEAPGTVTFHIPGDGTFKLARNGKALMDLLKRAKSMKTGEAPIKASENLIRKPAGPGAYTEAGSYAQHLYETLGKEAAITDQKAQLAQVSSKSQAAKLIKDTLSELSKYSDKEEPQGATVASETGVQQGTVAVNTQPLTVIPNGAIKTPKSQRQIITDIAKGLKVPIRFGRLRTSKFSGYFIPKLNLIGSKLADNIPIVSHEAGHKLDREFKMSENKAIASELNVLGDPKTAGSMSSWTKSKTNKYKMGEGVAEFIRYWLTDPTHAEQVAPNTFKVFESLLDENKDMGDTLRQAQSDIHTWRTASSQARLRSQISIGDNPNKTRYTLKQLTRDLVDDLHILRLAVADAAKGLGRPLEPSKDPYLLARNLRGSYGMAGTFVRDGVVDFNTKEVTMGSSFEDALKPVAGRIGDFRDWIVAKGAQDLMRQGKETGLVKSDVDSVVARFDKDPAFQKALGDLQVWSANLVKYAVDSGLLTPKSGAAMLRAHQIYVPLHRVFEIGAGEAPSVEGTGTGRGLNVGKPGTLKYRSGSTRQIVDPLETWVKNAYAIITASEKAAINHAVAGLARLPDMGKWVEQVKGPQEKVQVGIDKIREQLIDAGADPDMLPDDLMLSFYRQSKQAPFSENTIRIVDRNGKQQFFRLDRDLFDTFHALDLEDSGHLVRALSKPGQLLRSGVVLEPSFALANVMRDLFSSVVISKRGALPFEAPLRGAAALIGNHKLVAEWAAAGGESAIEINYFDRGKMQTYMKERITKDLTPFERALVVAKHPFYALRKLTAFSEEATRIGEYQLAYNALRKSGMAEGEARRLAAFESRDRQDFAKGGAKTKIPRAMTPFWNAALQGNLKLAQAFRERPTRTILQGIAWVTIPKMIEQAVNWDDKDYWDRPQWERDAFFLIPAGKDETGHTRFIRIPTPFEVGIIFGTIPGRMMQWAKTNRQDAMKNFASSFLQQTVPNPMPQVFQVVYEDFMSGKQGWDVYRGRPIVPDSLADLPPELQFTDQTSTLAKKMGEMTGMSPMKIDHIIGQTTGGMGKVLSGQQVPGKRFVTTPLRVSNQTIEDFYQKLGELKADYQRAKAGTKDVTVEELPAFNKAARRMGELRTAARVAEDEQTKAQLQEEIYQIARRMMGREEVNK